MTEEARERSLGVGRMSARAASWMAWLLCALTLVLVACAFALAVLNDYGFWNVFFLFSEVPAALVGALIASRRPANLVGWLILGHALCFTLGEFTRQYAIYGVLTEPGALPFARAMAWPPYWIWFPGIIVMFSLLPLYFPNGRLLSPRWRPVVWLAVFAAVIMSSLAAVQPNDGETPGIPNPLGIEALQPYIDMLGASLLLWLGLGVASGVSLVVRFRRSGGEERQQIKWVVYAVGLLLFFSLLSAVEQLFLWDLRSAAMETLFLIALSGLWISIAVAILRYRLYEIDFLINRTLVYGALTAMLAAVYFGGVATTQALFRALTGQEQQPQLAIVVSTLAIAALFNPLRRRIQGFIDRRFYRKKYDARKTLEAFSAKLRDETDLHTLNNHLVEVVRETMQPAHVSLWLRPDRPPNHLPRASILGSP